MLAHAAVGGLLAARQEHPVERPAVQHFGAQLVLTPDENGFLDAWLNARTLHNLPATDTVHRGESVTAVLVFQGCTPDQSGKCDVVADFSLRRPDGAYVPGGYGMLWSDEPAPSHLHLGKASMGLSFDASDPVGDYKIVTTITDMVSGQTLELRSELHVLE